jgi:hypothetical protein
MISQNVANRVGIILQFLSLWLVTPQIIGEEILDKAETMAQHMVETLHKWLSWLKFLLFAAVPVSLAALFWAALRITSELNSPTPANATSGGPKVTVLILAIASTVELVAISLLLLIPILRLLAWAIRKGKTLKQHLLVYGAGFFTLGFALLLWATWLKL